MIEIIILFKNMPKQVGNINIYYISTLWNTSQTKITKKKLFLLYATGSYWMLNLAPLTSLMVYRASSLDRLKVIM